MVRDFSKHGILPCFGLIKEIAMAALSLVMFKCPRLSAFLSNWITDAVTVTLHQHPGCM